MHGFHSFESGGTATDHMYHENQTTKNNNHRTRKETPPLMYPPTAIHMFGDMPFGQVTGSSTVIYDGGT
jgi:hypothetical protein